LRPLAHALRAGAALMACFNSLTVAMVWFPFRFLMVSFYRFLRTLQFLDF